jgi:hypothetical protein
MNLDRKRGLAALVRSRRSGTGIAVLAAVLVATAVPPTLRRSRARRPAPHPVTERIRRRRRHALRRRTGLAQGLRVVTSLQFLGLCRAADRAA